MDALERQAVERTVDDLASRFDGAELTRALDDFGWEDVFRSDPVDAVDALLSAQGRAGSWSAALHDVLIMSLGLPGSEFERSAVLIPRPGSEFTGTSDGAADGLLVGARPEFDAVIAVAGWKGSVGLFGIPRERLLIESHVGLDSRLQVQLVQARFSVDELLAEGDSVSHQWSTVVAAGRRVLSFQLCGAMEAMIGFAVTHATDRHQFGRPVGAFQAVRHRLAESRVASSGAYSAARASFDDHEPVVAALAGKVVAGRAQKLVAAHCQQILAGVGFTADHPFHNFMFRATVLDRLFGSSAELAIELGRVLIERGRAVRLAEL